MLFTRNLKPLHLPHLSSADVDSLSLLPFSQNQRLALSFSSLVLMTLSSRLFSAFFHSPSICSLLWFCPISCSQLCLSSSCLCVLLYVSLCLRPCILDKLAVCTCGCSAVGWSVEVNNVGFLLPWYGSIAGPFLSLCTLWIPGHQIPTVCHTVLEMHTNTNSSLCLRCTRPQSQKR